MAAKQKPKRQFDLRLSLDMDELAEMIVDSVLCIPAFTDNRKAGRNEVFDLIKALDIGMADYEFTLDLARHLVKELIAASESSEPFKLTDLTD